MAVVTVTGEIPATELGITDIHEHILCDLSQNFEAPGVSEGISGDEKVDMTTLGIVTNNPASLKDNLILADVDLAIDEILEFGRAGGKTIVDVTTSEFGRDPLALRHIARATGINIVAGTGHYIQAYHSSVVGSLSVEELAVEMTKEILEGISNSGVRAGVIGEVGTSVEIHPDERKVLAAAARVNRHLGVPVIVHTDSKSRLALEALHLLSEAGADLSKVSICHLDCGFFEDTYLEDILKTGARIELDTFGENFCLHPDYGPSDLDRVKLLKWLLDKGYACQIMLGGDICLKCRLHRYGGWGYDHLLRNVLPAMKRQGISDEQIDIMLVQNPRAFLDF
ncbi:MAG TPA: hypothetical protein ENI27_01645 [bacterium]|nr:hypothetical protein [bacterium]